MITIGVDPHKGLQVAEAVDEAGSDVAEWRGPKSPEGWARLSAWAADLGTERQWGIESAWSYDGNDVRERFFKRLLEQAGLSPMRLHTLRHLPLRSCWPRVSASK